MPLEMTCRTCGKPYVPSRAEILKGPDTYRVCPDCRRAIENGDVAAIFNREPDDSPEAA